MQKKKTHEQYVDELKDANNSIVVLDKYINSEVPIEHKCLICNYHWKARPVNILRGKGCPKCAGILKRTTQSYMEEIRKINPNILPLEDYINVYTQISHKCLIHNVEWSTSPSSVLQGCGCYMCGAEKLRKSNTKSNEQYLAELKKVNPNIIPLEKYKGASTKILHKCLIDGYEWKAQPAHELSGYGCPKCKVSKGEHKIAMWLESHNIPYEVQYKFDDCKDQKSLPFDFYLPQYNVCIEFDGEQHFRPINFFGGEEKFKRQQLHDKIKNEYCKSKDIPLLRISFNQNIEEKLDNFLFN